MKNKTKSEFSERMNLLVLWMVSFFSPSFVVIKGVQCGAKIMLTMQFYENRKHKEEHTNECCERYCFIKCDTYFKICLSSKSRSRICDYGQAETKSFDDMDYITFPTGENALGTRLSNPLVFSVKRYGGVIFNNIESWDSDKDDVLHTSDDFMGNFSKSVTMQPYTNRSAAVQKETHFSLTYAKLQVTMTIFCDDNYLVPTCSEICLPTDDETGHFACDYQKGLKYCLKNWYGDSCLKFCKPTNSDEGHYVCNETNGKKVCLRGWKDPKHNCLTESCELRPCQNRGRCRDVPTEYVCMCEQGFTGRQCQTKLDPCQNNTCKNNAACIGEDFVSYKCVCKPGFSGKYCSLRTTYCGSQPCVNGGNCLENVNDYTCVCQSGYTGKNCHADINDCRVGVCKNGGRCIDKNNDFQCQCKPGFTGRDCSSSVEYCWSRPCMNNATCINTLNSYKCLCLPGFSEKDCSDNVNDCLHNRCKNGSTCVDGLNTYTCSCAPGFTGYDCSQLIDHCHRDVCQNNGTCINERLGYYCACQEGFTGFNCSVNIDDCGTNLCKNHATCVDGINNYTCICLQGFTSTDCSINIDDCSTHGCKNNATCVDGINSYSCQCKAGYTSDDCSIKINECRNHTCQNNATCVDEIGGYRCSCKPGFTGTYCSIRIYHCDRYTCQNNGSCMNHGHGYLCSCKQGFTGVNCESQVFQDGCKKKPCLNNGTCVSLRPGTHHCHCKNHYTGEYCQTVILPLSSNVMTSSPNIRTTNELRGSSTITRTLPVEVIFIKLYLIGRRKKDWPIKELIKTIHVKYHETCLRAKYNDSSLRRISSLGRFSSSLLINISHETQNLTKFIHILNIQISSGTMNRKCLHQQIIGSVCKLKNNDETLVKRTESKQTNNNETLNETENYCDSFPTDHTKKHKFIIPTLSAMTVAMVGIMCYLFYRQKRTKRRVEPELVEQRYCDYLAHNDEKSEHLEIYDVKSNIERHSSFHCENVLIT